MRKLLQMGFWWIPVLIAVTVGLLLYFINGMSFVAVWRDEALIAGICAGYGLMLRQFPVSGVAYDDIVEPANSLNQGALQPAHLIGDQRKFLGHRYPAGCRPVSTARTGK